MSATASLTTAGGERERLRGARAFLSPAPVRGGKTELGAGLGNWRLAGHCARKVTPPLGAGVTMETCPAGRCAHRLFRKSVARSQRPVSTSECHTPVCSI